MRVAVPLSSETLTRSSGLSPESQGQNLAVTALYVPYWLDSGVAGVPSSVAQPRCQTCHRCQRFASCGAVPEGCARCGAVQWCNPYIAYPQCSTSPNVARRARSRRPKSYGLPMPLYSITPNVAPLFMSGRATLRVTPLY